ncbi:TonB-dependent receptor domain-containing protein [Vibrio sonorensis]|uniref:TonB-dependent receptor domain-containing protein n=1 Tax=Vibrio sonorensis TaxID=1004316 RepID=UPI0008D9EE76|nr:TonB-dependent receptor [Vibrio sonorensis]
MKLNLLSLAVVTACSASLSLTAYAEEDYSYMKTTVVTANQYETSIKEAPASISVVTSEEIEKLPATDVTTALESVPGVHIAKSSGSEPRIIIRGLQNQNSSNGNYTLFLINGRRVSSSEAVVRGATFDLSSIPMSAVKQIEVVRGPMSSLYGSEAIGGVVNVILKEPTNDTHVAGSVSYTIPQDNSPSSVISDADGDLKTGNIYISGSIIPDVLLYNFTADISDRSAWYPDNAGTHFSPLTKQQRQAFRAGFNWLASDQDEFYLDLSFANDDRTEYPTFSGKTFVSEYQSQKFTSTLGYLRDWDWGESDVSYFYETTNIDEDNFRTGINDAKQNNHTLDGKFVLSQLESQVISLGGQISYTNIENDRDYSDTRSVTQSALYLQDEIGLSDDLTASLSGRLTHNNQFGNDFSPRVYMVYNGLDNFTFKGGYGEGFKAPTIFQSSKDFSLPSCGGRCTLIGNPDLKAQSSKTYELSAMYYASRGYVQATWFFNDVKDLIDRDLDPFFNGGKIIQYENVDRVETKGIELESELDITKSWLLSMNATYTNSNNKETNKAIPLTPEWLANANLNWLASEELSLFASVNYTGKQEDGKDNNLDPYSIVSLGGSYQFNDNFIVRTGVTNLTDKRLDQSTFDYQATEIGRSFYLKFDFEF